MVSSSVLGFPRMGAQRELKKANEAHWAGKISEAELHTAARELRAKHWQLQSTQGVQLMASNDASLFDHVLDHSLLFNLTPKRYQGHNLSVTETVFAMGRGLQRPAKGDKPAVDVTSLEMVKWFDSNYHYLKPEVGPELDIKLIEQPKPVTEFLEAKSAGFNTRPVLLGPVSLLYLSKATHEAPQGFQPLEVIDRIVPAYIQLLKALQEAGATSVQIDEPILVLDLPVEVQARFQPVYAAFNKEVPDVAITLATYFGSIVANETAWRNLPVAALHVDLVRNPEQLGQVIAALAPTQKLSAGVVDGRNVWKTDFAKILALLKPVLAILGAERLIVATSSSLLHTPHSLEAEEKQLSAEVRDWFSFAKEKCREVAIITRALTEGEAAIKSELDANAASVAARLASPVALVAAVRERQAKVTPELLTRKSAFPKRQAVQRDLLKLPAFPTTTIGSFPQTKEIRVARDRFVKKQITEAEYDEFLQGEIRRVVQAQEEIGLDVLVHGEAERNDMVQYFLERMDGCVFTANGWVQSYGSRCVRPPIIVGDVSRPKAMTVKESLFAKSCTKLPMKGMLTGPVTCLRWSFPRVDVTAKEQCEQLALAIRDEVADLERAGMAVIQIDEPALREGLPLRKDEQPAYLKWAVDSFRLSTACVTDQTQIHSHFCYSEFNELIDAIAALDADVITIESSKSDLKLLAALKAHKYPAEIGPGVYDIHSPRVPSVAEMLERIEAMVKDVNTDMLWINPDCGLKTRGWTETMAALTNMVQAAKEARRKFATKA